MSTDRHLMQDITVNYASFALTITIFQSLTLLRHNEYEVGLSMCFLRPKMSYIINDKQIQCKQFVQSFDNLKQIEYSLHRING